MSKKFDLPKLTNSHTTELLTHPASRVSERAITASTSLRRIETRSPWPTGQSCSRNSFRKAYSNTRRSANAEVGFPVRTSVRIQWWYSALLPGWNNPVRECCGRWTPDGRYFLFVSTHNRRTNIWALPEPFVSTIGLACSFSTDNRAAELFRNAAQPGRKQTFSCRLTAAWRACSRFVLDSQLSPNW